MTRLIGSPEHAGSAVAGLFRQFNWHHISWIYHNHHENTGRGNSDCSFTCRAIQKKFPNIVGSQMVFDENRDFDYRSMLNEIKKESRSELKQSTNVVQTCLDNVTLFCFHEFV